MNQSELKSEQSSTTPVFKPILFSALILISGIVIGAGLTLIVTGNSNTRKSLPPAPEYMSARMVKRIAGELNLSPEQQEQLKPIVQKHMKAMDDIRRKARPEISEELKQMNEEILSILNEPQRKIWQNRIQRMQVHFTRMGHRRGSGGGRRNERHHERRFPPERKPPIDDVPPPPPGEF